MAKSITPLLLIGGGALLLMGRKKKKKKSSGTGAGDTEMLFEDEEVFGEVPEGGQMPPSAPSAPSAPWPPSGGGQPSGKYPKALVVYPDGEEAAGKVVHDQYASGMWNTSMMSVSAASSGLNEPGVYLWADGTKTEPAVVGWNAAAKAAGA